MSNPLTTDLEASYRDTSSKIEPRDNRRGSRQFTKYEWLIARPVLLKENEALYLSKGGST